MGEANGGLDLDIGSSQSRVIWLTYKRRKYTRNVEDGGAGEPRLGAKGGARFVQMNSGDCSLNHQRNIVLQEIFQSLERDGGLKKCIHDALAFHTENDTRTMMKKSIPSCEPAINLFSSHGNSTNTSGESMGMCCNRSVYGSKRFTVTEHCCCTFSDIIMSENFSKLCCLLHQNGMKAEKLLDFSHINLKLKDNTYEISPLLFQSDIQQVWAQIEKVGNDIVNLARSISDAARSSFQEKVLMEESGKHEEGRAESYPFNKLHTCRQCGEKADGSNGLVCDSCEKIYHISCIDPPVKKIPTKSWYCINCTVNGIGLPHESCVVCQRMSSLTSPCYEDDELMYSKGVEEFKKSSKEEVLPNCKVCHNAIRNDEDYKGCSHSLCSHKFYHVKCLMSNELQSHARRWYCPSCLCRACLVDQDDHKIVLCDGCDHGYHIYCMQPPLDSIPKGRWFCETCDNEIKCIQKARCLYENIQNKSKRGCKGNAINKSGGVDMLLNAARNLKHEESLDRMGLKA